MTTTTIRYLLSQTGQKASAATKGTKGGDARRVQQRIVPIENSDLDVVDVGPGGDVLIDATATLFVGDPTSPSDTVPPKEYDEAVPTTEQIVADERARRAELAKLKEEDKDPPLLTRVLRSLGLVAAYVGACCAATLYGLRGSSGGSPWVFALTTYGFTTLIVESAILKPVREAAGRIPIIGPGLYIMDKDERGVEGLLSCPFCTGTWVGLALAALGVTFFPVGHGIEGFRDMLCHGCFGAGACWLLAAAYERIIR